jgi:hypothetical protein
VSTIEWVFLLVAFGLIPVHIYYGIRYREFFTVSQATINTSYWSMIAEFKKHHPRGGLILSAAIWLQVAVVIALAIARLSP